MYIIISFISTVIITALFNKIRPLNIKINNKVNYFTNIVNSKKKDTKSFGTIIQIIIIIHYLIPPCIIGLLIGEILFSLTNKDNDVGYYSIIHSADNIIILFFILFVLNNILMKFIEASLSLKRIHYKNNIIILIFIGAILGIVSYGINLYHNSDKSIYTNDIINSLNEIPHKELDDGTEVYQSWGKGDYPDAAHSFHYAFSIKDGKISPIDIYITSDSIDRVYNSHAIWAQMEFTGYDNNGKKKEWILHDDYWKNKLISYRKKDNYTTWKGNLWDIHKGINIIIDTSYAYGYFKAGGSQHINSYSTSFQISQDDVQRMHEALYLESLFEKISFDLNNQAESP